MPAVSRRAGARPIKNHKRRAVRGPMRGSKGLARRDFQPPRPAQHHVYAHHITPCGSAGAPSSAPRPGRRRPCRSPAPGRQAHGGSARSPRARRISSGNGCPSPCTRGTRSPSLRPTPKDRPPAGSRGPARSCSCPPSSAADTGGPEALCRPLCTPRPCPSQHRRRQPGRASKGTSISRPHELLWSCWSSAALPIAHDHRGAVGEVLAEALLQVGLFEVVQELAADGHDGIALTEVRLPGPLQQALDEVPSRAGRQLQPGARLPMLDPKAAGPQGSCGQGCCREHGAGGTNGPVVELLQLRRGSCQPCPRARSPGKAGCRRTRPSKHRCRPPSRASSGTASSRNRSRAPWPSKL
mmetsp:Transcript_158084/g.507179  ORF Transcript_158084/g.507179 Transcript_158084/m.507179 type:complete len:354 (+) Transcript_158084:890-1951(+)